MTIKIVIGSIITTVSFAVLFNVRGKKLIYAGIVGVSAAFVVYGARHLGLSLVSAQFLGSLTLSSLAEIFARKVKTPVTTFIVCALIPLVPGGQMYLSMKALMENNVALSNEILINVLAQSGAIALGIVVVSTISAINREFTRRKKI